ncbi:hypothetical protein EON67_11925 [archaeon]|nr:MAG: hypothetical protein EON67_11925 [archaeon]
MRAENCVAYKPTTSGAVAYYVKSAACDFDNKVVGLSFYAASDSQCTGATLGSMGDVVMERCSQLSGPLSGVQVMYTCPSTPCCQTTAVVGTLLAVQRARARAPSPTRTHAQTCVVCLRSLSVSAVRAPPRVQCPCPCCWPSAVCCCACTGW